VFFSFFDFSCGFLDFSIFVGFWLVFVSVRDVVVVVVMKDFGWYRVWSCDLVELNIG